MRIAAIHCRSVFYASALCWLLMAAPGICLRAVAAEDADAGDVPTAGAPAYVQNDRLMEDDPFAEDLFGSDLAWDGTTLVVGVPSHDQEDDTNKGAVEIYPWDGAGYSTPTELTPTDDTESFGRALAMDGNTLAVAAKSKERTGEDILPFYTAYTVYIYVFDGGTWEREAMLWSEDANAPINNFGYDVALHGDTLAVGAPDAVVNGKNRMGAVHVFTRSQGIWTRQAILSASDGDAQDYFGRAVAIQGDTLLVGTAPLFSAAAAVYHFERVAGQWYERQIIADPNPQDNRFGETLVLDGATAAISDWLDNTNGSQESHSGTVYLYTKGDAGWAYQAKVGEGVNLEFGRAVALAGDLLVVGAPAVRGLGAGAVHLFLQNGENWLYRGQLSPEDAADENDRFGDVVAVAGANIVVGAPQKSTPAGKWLGAAYVYGAAGDELFLPMLGR